MAKTNEGGMLHMEYSIVQECDCDEGICEEEDVWSGPRPIPALERLSGAIHEGLAKRSDRVFSWMAFMVICAVQWLNVSLASKSYSSVMISLIASATALFYTVAFIEVFLHEINQVCWPREDLCGEYNKVSKEGEIEEFFQLAEGMAIMTLISLIIGIVLVLT